jgi:hypothetical protein
MKTTPNRTMPRKPTVAVPILKRGVDQWYVTIPKELNRGKARRLFFRTFEGAENKAEELERSRESAGARSKPAGSIGPLADRTFVVSGPWRLSNAGTLT